MLLKNYLQVEVNLYNVVKRNHFEVFSRGRMVDKLEEGRNVMNTAEEFVIDKSIVSRSWNVIHTIRAKSSSPIRLLLILDHLMFFNYTKFCSRFLTFSMSLEDILKVRSSPLFVIFSLNL